METLKRVDQLFDSCVQSCWHMAKGTGTMVQKQVTPWSTKVGSMATLFSCSFTELQSSVSLFTTLTNSWPFGITETSF